MGVGERLERRPPGTGQVTAGFQVIGQALRLVERPGLEGGQELALVDKPILKREQSEEKMAVGGAGHGVAPGADVAPRIPDQTHDHGALVRGERRIALEALRVVTERRPVRGERCVGVYPARGSMSHSCRVGVAQWY